MAYIRVEGNVSSRHPFYGVGGVGGDDGGGGAGTPVTTLATTVDADHRLREDVTAPAAGTQRATPAYANARYPADVQKEAAANAENTVRVPIVEFQRTLGMGRRARGLLDKAVQENPELEARFGAHVHAFEEAADRLSQQVSLHRSYAPGAVVLPAGLWAEITAFVATACKMANEAFVEVEPMRVVVPNGMSQEEAMKRGVLVNSTR